MPKSQPARRPVVLQDDYEVDQRLNELGIRRGWLIDASQRGRLHGLNAPIDGYAGNVAYRAGDATLSELCTSGEAGWARGVHHRSLPACLNLARRIAISVTMGDENVGVVTDYDPKTTTLKGPVTRSAAHQPSFGDVSEEFDPPWDWFYLLLYLDGGDFRIELSAPSDVSDDGRVTGWLERILIGDVDGGDRPIARRVTPQDDAPVIVRRKSA